MRAKKGELRVENQQVYHTACHGSQKFLKAREEFDKNGS